MRILLVVAFVLLFHTIPASAYVGPGVGVTLIGWFAGFVLTGAAALAAIIQWPLRKLLERKRTRISKASDDKSDIVLPTSEL